MSTKRDADDRIIDVNRRVERALGRVSCGACRAPKATGKCPHVIVTDERVIVSKARWLAVEHGLVALRKLAGDEAAELEAESATVELVKWFERGYTRAAEAALQATLKAEQ